MQKILRTAIITTGRADYGLLRPLIKKIDNSDNYELFVIATGSHLSQIHGMTIHEIEKDGFDVHYKVEITQKKDSEHDICNAISIGIEQFSNVYNLIKPDFIIVLGDRYELWSVCIPAVIHKIPIVHLHGGEITSGLIDDSVRHSITKMASYHFASINDYAKRIIQMGEDRRRVFVVGALGIDNIKSIDFMSYQELYDFTGLNFHNPIALMTFHPVTLDERKLAVKQVQSILNSLLKFNLTTLITMPNSDPAGIIIYKEITKYLNKNPLCFRFMESLGQKAYISAMNYATLMIGNSSSGIIESASFKIPVVNIGDRQTGRIAPPNVINSTYAENDIYAAIKLALSSHFKKSISNINNPYGNGSTAQKIEKHLNSIDFIKKDVILKKGFMDLEFIDKL